MPGCPRPGRLRPGGLSKVQWVDQRMRLECGVGFRQLRTCRRARPGQAAKCQQDTGSQPGGRDLCREQEVWNEEGHDELRERQQFAAEWGTWPVIAAHHFTSAIKPPKSFQKGRLTTSSLPPEIRQVAWFPMFLDGKTVCSTPLSRCIMEEQSC